MSANAQMIWTTIADFVLSAGGVVTGAMMQQGQMVVPGKGVLLFAAITGVVTAFSHIKASLAKPPQ